MPAALGCQCQNGKQALVHLGTCSAWLGCMQAGVNLAARLAQQLA